MNIGIKGISYSTTERKYLVRTRKNSKTVYIGRYSSLEEAKEALASYSDVPSKEASNTPILESLRATFASKKTKTTSYKTKSSKSTGKSSDTVKITKENVKKVPKTLKGSNATMIFTEKPKVSKKSNVDELMEVQEMIFKSTIDNDAIKHNAGEQHLHTILKYLLKEADKRETTVFDVVVQEVAKLSKK